MSKWEDEDAELDNSDNSSSPLRASYADIVKNADAEIRQRKGDAIWWKKDGVFRRCASAETGLWGSYLRHSVMGTETNTGLSTV